MYISKLEIKNIKCLDNIVIDFKSASDTCCGGVILGDNGLGKTTILRCIAMSLCGKASISGLMDELEGEWIKFDKHQASISLEIKPDINNENAYQILTTFNRSDINNEVDITQDIYPEGVEFPWDKFLVCGYGASRGVTGSENYSTYTVTDAIYTLFNYKQVLQNPELVLRRIVGSDYRTAGKTMKKVLPWLDKILMLPKGSTKLNKSLTIDDSFKRRLPVEALADGYQATITWVTDMLGWALLQDDEVFRKKISGIVLIDEIEHHLHPKWQRNIVPILQQVFPEVQFITTTHAPLVAANCSKLLPDEPDMKVFSLSQKGKKVLLSIVEENLGELNIAQVLSSEAFDHIFSINPKIDGFLRKASILAAKDSRTNKEEATLKIIKDIFKDIIFPKGETLIERMVERDYYDELEKRAEELNRILNEGNK